ncbi:hypothetical protein J3459_012058 [Metarhizium acridum]|nr:hypothetical protein J3459_012058 [Metarhizium acridum]
MLKNNSEGFARCHRDVDCSWGQVRIHDLIITIQWLLENHPLSPEEDSVLWENMDMFYSQNPRNWDAYYANVKPADPGDSSSHPFIHGVNVGQGEHINYSCGRWYFGDVDSPSLGLKHHLSFTAH